MICSNLLHRGGRAPFCDLADFGGGWTVRPCALRRAAKRQEMPDVVCVMS